MKNLFVFIWFILLMFTPLCFSGVDTITVLQVEMAFILSGLWVFYNKCPKPTFDSVFIILVIYSVWIGLTDSFITYMPIYLSVLECFCFSLLLLYQFYKRNDFKSDKISSKGIYLILFKPKTFIQYLFSLFGSPFASLGSIINGKVYRLKHSKSVMCVSKINKQYIQDNYYVVKVANKIDNVEEIEKELLKQSAYSGKRFNTRTNCVESQKPLFDNLSDKWHTKGILDFIPSIYINRRIKG